MPIQIRTKKEKAEIETQQVNSETKVSNVQYNLKSNKLFCTSYSSIHFGLFFERNNFLPIFFNLNS